MKRRSETLGQSQASTPPLLRSSRPLLQLLAGFVTGLCLVLVAPSVYAQDDEEMTFEEDDTTEEQGEEEIEFEEGSEPPPLDEGTELDDLELVDPDAGAGAVKPVTADAGQPDVKASWEDILVVIRKPFLKSGRLEILPQWGITMNDNLLRHIQLSTQLNYFLTDVLSVGVEGALYFDQQREPFDLVARQARRLPTVNKYNYSASFNFNYVPIYGKFAILDKHLIHWETYFTAGIGITESEVLPRDPALQPFKNFLISPNVGASMRFFITKWLTVNAGIRDYIFIDKFEAQNRTEVSGDVAKEMADSSLINNVLFQAGVSFWFPPSFEYTTFR